MLSSVFRHNADKFNLAVVDGKTFFLLTYRGGGSIGKLCYKYKLFCKLFLLLLFQVAEDLCLSLQDLSRKARVYYIDVPASLDPRISLNMGQVL